jgi:hypothetical protein
VPAPRGRCRCDRRVPGILGRAPTETGACVLAQSLPQTTRAMPRLDPPRLMWPVPERRCQRICEDRIDFGAA